MSLFSLNTIGSVTATQLQQARTVDADRAVQDAKNQSRETAIANAAEAAEGIGKTSEDGETTDRDADGRQLWEKPQHKNGGVEPAANETDGEPHSIDPTGQSGLSLDLTG